MADINIAGISVGQVQINGSWGERGEPFFTRIAAQEPHPDFNATLTIQVEGRTLTVTWTKNGLHVVTDETTHNEYDF